MINSKVLKIARKLRKEMTEGEKVLWKVLRGKGLDNYKFRRQFPLVYDNCGFVADFYCAQCKLIIEVDGGVHDNKDAKEYDEIREDVLIKNGYKVIRFKNEEVLCNIDEVIREIKKTLS